MIGAVERSAKTRRRKGLRAGAGKKPALRREGNFEPSPHHDRPFWPPGAEIAAQAWQAFDEWCQTRERDGRDYDVLELVDLYAARSAGRARA